MVMFSTRISIKTLIAGIYFGRMLFITISQIKNILHTELSTVKKYVQYVQWHAAPPSLSALEEHCTVQLGTYPQTLMWLLAFDVISLHAGVVSRPPSAQPCSLLQGSPVTTGNLYYPQCPASQCYPILACSRLVQYGTMSYIPTSTFLVSFTPEMWIKCTFKSNRRLVSRPPMHF